MACLAATQIPQTLHTVGKSDQQSLQPQNANAAKFLS